MVLHFYGDYCKVNFTYSFGNNSINIACRSFGDKHWNNFVPSVLNFVFDHMRNTYFELYLLTESGIAKLTRAAILSGIIIFLFLTFQTAWFKIPLIILSLFLINELFIASLSKRKPKDNITFSAQVAFSKSKNAYEVLEKISRQKEVRFFLEKLGIERLEKVDISHDELLSQASDIVNWVRGNYVTQIDFAAAYVLLAEETTHFMQKNNLNNDDVINVCYWARRKFSPDDFSKKTIRLLGPGVFDTLVESWNYELKKYSKNLTSEVLAKAFPPNNAGREKEYGELITALSRKKSSNVILIGEPGVGKMSLVEFLAYESFFGYTPQDLCGKKVFELFPDRILSGANNTGELETRLVSVLSEIMHSENAIVVIQGIESIFGGSGFNMDISGVLMEYLESDRIKIIGTTTQITYASYIENKPSIRDLFEKVDIKELDRAPTLLLLTDKARGTEAQYGVFITYPALKQVVLLSPSYFPDRFFPGRAIDLLESVASKISLDKKKIIEAQDVIEFVQGKTNIALSEPDEHEKELLLSLEEKMHQRVIGQEEAISAVANTLRRLRSGFKNEKKPISVMLFLGPTGVGKTETAKALAAEYFGDQKAMIRLDMSEYQTQEQIRRILGESPGEEIVANALTDKAEKNPFSLILLDEFEKAHPHLLDIFLQIFDEGRVTDNRGKTVSFTNTIIIATSNAGSEFIREKINKGETSIKEELVEHLLKNNIFKPELMNRFDDVIVFRPLTQEEILKVSRILLAESLSTLSDNGIKLFFDDNVVSKIAEEAYDPTFGARNIRRYIEDNVESYISKLILQDQIKKGGEAKIGIDENNTFVVI